MENHDRAYTIWRDCGVKEKILLHIDAHHDMWWIKEKGFRTIANFVCQALREDQVREMYWVTPDPTWKDASGRRPILAQVKKIVKQYPGPPAPIRIEDGRIRTSILGKPLHVCSLAALPCLDEPVLLDIDVDFMMIPRLSVGVDFHSDLPWCWPADLMERMAALGVRAELVTIVYSVEGGYTPLKWKYLGDELALRLQGRNEDDPMMRGMERIRQGAEAERRNQLDTAEQLYREAAALLPGNAALSFRLAHLCARTGRIDEARRCYQKALELDPSYRTPYNSSGLWNLWGRRFRASEQEHRSTLDLDPQDAYAHYGMGRLAARRKRWSEAQEWYAKAVALDGGLVDAWRELGNACYALGQRQNAIEAYTRALRLVIEGHRPLGAPIITSQERNPDPARWYVHAKLARLHDLQGNQTQAINGYKMAIAGGHDRCLLRLRLARLYLLRKHWLEGAGHIWKGLARTPGDIWFEARRMFHRLRIDLKEHFRSPAAPRAMPN